MSVRVLTTEGDGATVVTDDARFELSGRAILVKGLDAAQLEGTQCNTSYDLRVGDRYREHSSRHEKEVEAGGEIKVKPGMAVIIQTEEEVGFPVTAFGQIVPRVKFLKRGLANTPTKVDPGYRGRLLVTVFNHGTRTVTLKRGTPFCSLFVVSVDAGARAYPNPSQQLPGPGETRWRGARRWVTRRLSNQLTWTAIAAVIAVAF